MSKISHDTKQKDTAEIRSLLVRNDDLTISEIVELLKSQTPALARSYNYVKGIKRKIQGERTYRLNYQTLNSTLARIEDSHKERQKILWSIATDPLESSKAKISALREIKNSELALFMTSLNAGAFKHIPEPSQRTLSPESLRLVEEICN